MIKEILPIYRTGWFYLILLLLGAVFYTVYAGGFNQANQININILQKFISEQAPNDKVRGLEDRDVIALNSTLNEDDYAAITTLLSHQKSSQIVIQGTPTKSLIKKLKLDLKNSPIANKIIINSNDRITAKTLPLSSSMFGSSLINWFRYENKKSSSLHESVHFIFTPLILNHRQSIPLVWYQQGESFLTLPGEVIQQLTIDKQLTLSQRWQLALTSNQRTLGPKNLSLGFFGEVFSSGSAYSLNQQGRVSEKDQSKSPALVSIQQFVKQQYSRSATSSPKPQYKVIIITTQTLESSELIKPLLLNLTNNNYLSQNLLTLILFWLVAIAGIILIWFMRNFTIKQQLTSLLTYILTLVLLQSILFNHQQWFEISPVVILTVGLWALLNAYNQEVHLLSNSISTQVKGLKKSPLPLKPKKVLANKAKELYKSPQNFSPTATLVPAATAVDPFPSAPKLPATEALDKTMVVTPATKEQHRSASQQLAVENFGRYQVEGILGKGAMGIVYQGVDPKINRHVAIKTLQLSDDTDEDETSEAKERFFREAQTAGGLSHANIVTIYDVGEENNLGYIAMDLLTGAPLSAFTQRGHMLPVPLIYQLLIQITDALDYAHNQNVVHRDIKPGNIIYDDDLLKVTITDFGIAYVSDHSKTRTGVIMGSPYYMSPEQILGLKVDGRSDIFSLGVTFYQLLSGYLPFEGESIATVAYQITKAKPVAVNQHNTKLPASALRITNKAMHKDIDKRYQSMAEFKAALTSALKRDFKITAN